METLTKLSARSLEYYINARRWRSDLDFFNLEIEFLKKLMAMHFVESSNKECLKKIQNYNERLSELINKKHQLNELLDRQLQGLELLAQDLLTENVEELTGKHAHLEYMMIDWVHEYRKLKKELFITINERLDGTV